MSLAGEHVQKIDLGECTFDDASLYSKRHVSVVPNGSKRIQKAWKTCQTSGKSCLKPTYMILCLQDGFTPAPIKDSCIGYSSSVQLSHHFERLSWEWEQWNLPATVELKSREDREELGTGKRPWNSEGPSWDYPVARVFVNAVNENT